ncbi:MAG TPA: 50S ribosomal protein L15e [Candidatus Methanofastidiosa archaeon]|nr:50S ribosomal protein L15e [Candidatus Methanofastidiosa archaeon]
MGYYNYVKEAWKDPRSGVLAEITKRRLPLWNKEEAMVRVERPTRIDRARELGYRAKQGYVIVRVRVRRGGRRKSRPEARRRPRRFGVKKFSPKKGIQLIAEERVQSKYPNLEVLNSYWVGETGQSKYYEIILVDPFHPAIASDSRINWICEKQHTRRVNRGKTSAGRKSRGLTNKGKGAEKLRPSKAAHGNRGY